MPNSDGRELTRRSIFVGAAASLICRPAIVRAASLMPIRQLNVSTVPINPEKPWPHIERLAERTAAEGFELTERLSVYPEFVHRDEFIDDRLHTRVRAMAEEVVCAKAL